MTIDDPFADPPGDSERTVILPTPGGRRRAADPSSTQTNVGAQGAPEAPVPPAASPMPGKPVEIPALTHSKLNPLVNAALPLLDLAVQLKNRAQPPNLETLRDRVVAEINAFERRITPLGLSPQTIRAARYALCATIDDIVLNTPWGSGSIWSQRSMVATFHNEVLGGDRFWDLLNQLKRDAATNLDLLELLYFCISLGFEGKYRVTARGASELILVREDLYRLIRNNRGEFERGLSPHWKGVEAAHRGLRDLVPNWLVGIFALGVIGILYAIFTFALSTRVDAVVERLKELPPTKPAIIARAAPVAPPAPTPAPIVHVKTLEEFLAPEIAAHQVTVITNPQLDEVTVRITANMFESGSATLQPSVLPLLARIADALNNVAGPVQVIGYTDNQMPSLKYHMSNIILSEKRAEAVQAELQKTLSEPARLSSEGRGANDALGDNNTAEGRAQNRRVELVLMKAN